MQRRKIWESWNGCFNTRQSIGRFPKIRGRPTRFSAAKFRNYYWQKAIAGIADGLFMPAVNLNTFNPEKCNFPVLHTNFSEVCKKNRHMARRRHDNRRKMGAYYVCPGQPGSTTTSQNQAVPIAAARTYQPNRITSSEPIAVE